MKRKRARMSNPSSFSTKLKMLVHLKTITKILMMLN
jgi:hypothetical protein